MSSSYLGLASSAFLGGVTDGSSSGNAVNPKNRVYVATCNNSLLNSSTGSELTRKRAVGKVCIGMGKKVKVHSLHTGERYSNFEGKSHDKHY